MMTRNILDVAKYTGLNMLQKGLSISPLKLQKLLYYEQAWYMVFFNKEHLFDDVPEAWVNGPVYRSVWDAYKGKVKYFTDQLHEDDFVDGNVSIENKIKRLAVSMSLSENEIAFLDSVFNTYGMKSQDQLVLLTHAEKPWADQRKDLAPFEHSNRTIPLDCMYEYYNNRYQKRKPKNAVPE